MSDFFIGELLVLLLLVPVSLRPFVRSLQSVRGIVFLPLISMVLSLLIIAGSGFPISLVPVFFVVFVLFLGGLARMTRALRGLATDWYSLPSRIVYLVLFPVFLGSVVAAFYFAPENGYIGSVPVNKQITREDAAAGVQAVRHEWTSPAGTASSGTVVFFGDVSTGAEGRGTLAAVLAEHGHVFRADDYRSFYAWDHAFMAFPSFRFTAVRLGRIISGRAFATDDVEVHRHAQRSVARTMAALHEDSPDTPLFIVAEGSSCVPVAEYLHVSSSDVQGFVCLVSPDNIEAFSRSLDTIGFEGQYTVVDSETSMIPRFSAHLPVLVLSGAPGTMIGYGELDADDVLAALLLGGSRDTGRKRAERLARRIADWFTWRVPGEEVQQ